MSDDSEEIRIGTQVVYTDDGARPHLAFIVWIFPKISPFIDRPICNLATFDHSGYVSRQREIGPAYHDGARWHIIDKWSLPGELPEDEFATGTYRAKKHPKGWKHVHVADL